MNVRACVSKPGEDNRLRRALNELAPADGERVRALMTSLEVQDPYTASHQRKVSSLAVALAIELGMADHDVIGVALAAGLHDLGKGLIPMRILAKQGKLNDFEVGLLRVHPKAGHEMLKSIAFPWPVPQTVLQHHERLDGSGYPSGLQGDQIAPHSRIVAVADVMEAMTSRRPYRPPLPLGTALDHLTEARGKLYDVQAVDACIWLFTVKGFRPH